MSKKITKKGSASPKVRKFARELGANIVEIPGSQRAGRVTEEDVKKFVKSQVSVNQGKIEKKIYKDEYPHEAFGGVEVKDLPRVKKLSGPQLVRSWTEIPHVTQHDEIDVTEMEHFRTSLIDNYTGEKIRISPLAFITRAVVNALKKYPNFNSSIDSQNNKLVFKKYFHIGFAVDTPHGLMVPKIRNVDQMGLKEIFEELRIDLTRPIITTCGSGISASLLALALYVCGNQNVAVYDGSWTEWGGRKDTPISL